MVFSMRWTWRKLDSLIGTATATIFGLAALQLQAFIYAYLQRLGGHIDEARLSLNTIKNGSVKQNLGETALHNRLVANVQERLNELEAAHTAISEAAIYTKPASFFFHMDIDIAAATAQNFIPAVPLDPPSILFAGLGIVMGWLTWGAIKLPFGLYFKRRNQVTNI